MWVKKIATDKMEKNRVFKGGFFAIFGDEGQNPSKFEKVFKWFLLITRLFCLNFALKSRNFKKFKKKKLSTKKC